MAIQSNWIKYAVLSAQYTWSSFKKNPRSFLMGLFTIFLVVSTVGFLHNSLLKTSVIFMKLSEDSVGEYDLLLVPRADVSNNNTVSASLLNGTAINEILSSVDAVQGVVNRWTFLCDATSKNNPYAVNSSAVILAIHSDYEKEVGLGRSWNHRRLGEEEAHVSSSLLDKLGINANLGERILMDFNFVGQIADITGNSENEITDLVTTFLVDSGVITNTTQTVEVNTTQLVILATGTSNSAINVTLLLEGLGFNVTATDNPEIVELNVNVNQDTQEAVAAAILQSLNLQLEFTVVDSVSKPGGKYPTALGNVVVVEAQPFYETLQRSLESAFATGVVTSAIIDAAGVTLPTTVNASALFGNITIDDYAILTVVMMKDRFSAYKASLADMKARVNAFADAVYTALGFDHPSTPTVPVAVAVEGTYTIRLFLDQIFNATVVLIAILGCIMVFSLMISDVEQKTYEFGMLRALGMHKLSLVDLLLVQSFAFSAPGILLGLLGAFLACLPIEKLISDFVEVSPDYTIKSPALWSSILIGTFMPLLTNIVPIRRALSKTLKDALDLYHQAFSETKVFFVRLENLGLSLPLTLASILMVVFGFVVYYMIPYAFVFSNMALFFSIMMGILLAMIFGLVLISVTCSPLLQYYLGPLLVWGPDARLRSVLRKRLQGHFGRNRKTTLMFTLSLAFIVFAGVSLHTQVAGIQQSVKWLVGSDLVVQTLDYKEPLNEQRFRDYLGTETGDGGRVEAYAFVTFDMVDNTDLVRRTRAASLSSFEEQRLHIYGVDRDYLRATFSEYIMLKEVDSAFSYAQVNGEDDVVRSLFDDAGRATPSINLKAETDINGTFVPPHMPSGYASNLGTEYWFTFENGSLVTNITDVFINYPSTTLLTYVDQVMPTKAETQARTYTAYANYVDCIMSEALRNVIGVSVNTPIDLTVRVFNPQPGESSVQHYLGAVRAMAQKLPGFWFSSYSLTASFSPLLVSMEQYNRLMEDANERSRVDQPVRAVPLKSRLHIKLRPGISDDDKVIVKNSLSNCIEYDGGACSFFRSYFWCFFLPDNCYPGCFMNAP
eukprot:GCRY01002095.1.p1 GENE.GCRY01002095.1~~GCRY01002095.1.p1  ORF type:complete len:1063 (-),score=266.81 GCRY01002095.1:1135-4323(-)